MTHPDISTPTRRELNDTVGARMPTLEEVHTHAIPPGIPILVITHHTPTGELIEQVAPADRVTLTYTIDLDTPQPTGTTTPSQENYE